MTPERAAVEERIVGVVQALYDLSRAMELQERRALDAEEEARVLRERLEDRT